MQAERDIVTADPSVCPSVCPSHAGVVSKRMHISSHCPPSSGEWPCTCTVWETTTKFCIVIKLDVIKKLTGSTTNADARSLCNSWPSRSIWCWQTELAKLHASHMRNQSAGNDFKRALTFPKDLDRNLSVYGYGHFVLATFGCRLDHLTICLCHLLCLRPIGGGIKRWFCLTSVWRLSVCLSRTSGRTREQRGLRRLTLAQR